MKALDTILSAMKGKRIFDRFGFDLPQQNNYKSPKPQIVKNYDEWDYNPEISDWQNVMTQERLSGYELPPSLQAILENNINCSIS